MQTDEVFLSIVVPTKARPDGMRSFLQSLLACTAEPEQIEVIMVVDRDDEASRAIRCDGLHLVTVVVEPGRTMGELNLAGFSRARGRYIMLLNDDVRAETVGWDTVVRRILRPYADTIVLIHVNDGVFGETLCTFPLVSRTFCDLSNGLTDAAYRRYCIDDAIFHTFRLLDLLGFRRVIYLPDIMFRHENFELSADHKPVYTAIPEIFAADHAHLVATHPQRCEAALRMAAHIERTAQAGVEANRRDQIRFRDDMQALQMEALSRTLPLEAGSSNSRVTVVFFAENLQRATARACLRTLRAMSPGAELVVIDAANGSRARILNGLMRTCTTDYLAIVEQEVRVGQDWLPALLGCMSLDVAVAVASFADDTTSWSDHAILFDLTKLNDLQFDESFPSFFYDIDLRLRAAERGLRTVVRRCPGRLIAEPLRRDRSTCAKGLADEVDRWGRKWIASGRMLSADKGHAADLQQLFDMVRFPSVIDDLMVSDHRASSSQAFAAGVSERVQPLLGRRRLARAFWATLDIEVWNRLGASRENTDTRKRLITLGGMRKSTVFSMLAYWLHLEWLRWAGAAPSMGAEPEQENRAGGVAAAFASGSERLSRSVATMRTRIRATRGTSPAPR